MSLVVGLSFAFGSPAGADDAPAKRKSIYDAKADAKVQVEKATARAKHDGKRVLLMFGGDWCGWCHRLHTLFQENTEIRSLLFNEYELVMIDTKAPNAQTYLDQSSKDYSSVGYPFLAVLDADGKVLTGQRTGPLEEGDHHDPKKVKDFLTKWQIEPKDADALVRETLSRAASEDKRVFLTFGAPWCGWCHKLEDFLAKPDITALLEHDFLVVKVDVDRMKNGKEVMERYRPKESQGIPWFVVLDAKGEKHGTADAAFGNIGYPLEPKEIDAFMTLFESQGKLQPAQISELRKGLEKAAADIKAERAKREPAK
ncbi:thioredoxin family protein [Paludisphaera borealis]|uniref:thioredoxin family protein n=1 Tax=Paludisphaera borealis TaxID=1387353 RepID=UPI000970B3EB|nr:thioredoxin family protein [Paludisphaera borealis]